ncbi:MAG TPA: hypothetical protein VHH14_00530 [Solirubrobacterales bacterium]|nr:hypothetical protein [Solirubrobacterales bacterium]
MLNNILGGGQQRQEFDDFANRYEQGAPWDGISDDEAMQRYSQVAPQIPPDVYERSAQESFSRLNPDQRMQLGRYIQQQAPQYGVQFPDQDMNGQDDRLQDPGYLAQMTGRIHQQQPGLLGQILGGGGGGGGLGGGLGGALGGALGGGGGGGMLGNPIAKAALGGIAAMAVKQMMGGRR